MVQTVKCPSCGLQNSVGQQFCGGCGAKLIAETQQARIKCPNCGSQNLTGQQFCGTCGARLAGIAPPVPPTEVRPEVRPIIEHQQVEVKPTWGLAWGLWWRMLLLGLLIGGTLYLIALIVMLGLGFTLPKLW